MIGMQLSIVCVVRSRTPIPCVLASFHVGENTSMADRVGQQLGHYRLLRVLGQGAFADVYLAEHQYLERAAAIKVLHVQMEPETQEQF